MNRQLLQWVLFLYDTFIVHKDQIVEGSDRWLQVYCDFSETSIFDTMASTENLVLITQLKDEVESLKKQLALKEQQLLEKDKNVRKYTKPLHVHQ